MRLLAQSRAVPESIADLGIEQRLLQAPSFVGVAGTKQHVAGADFRRGDQTVSQRDGIQLPAIFVGHRAHCGAFARPIVEPIAEADLRQCRRCALAPIGGAKAKRHVAPK